MVFDAFAPWNLMTFSCFFPIIFHVNYRFVLGSILEAVLARFGIYFWSFGGSKSKSNQNDMKIQCENWHRNKYVLRRHEAQISWRAVGQDGGLGGKQTSPLG